MNTLLARKRRAFFAGALMLALLASAGCTLPFVGGTSQPNPCKTGRLPFIPAPLPPVSSIVAQDGVVYAGAIEAPQGHSFIYAFDARSGTLLWRSAIVPPTFQPNVAAVAAGVVYVTTGNTPSGPDEFSLLALRASDGTPLWRYNTGTRWPATVEVSGGIVYLAGDNGASPDPSFELYALRASDGTLLWQPRGAADNVGPFSAPTILGQVAYVYTGPPPPPLGGGIRYASIYALRVSDGQVIWSRRWDRHLATPFAAPLVVDGVLYTSVEATGSVYALRASDGAVLWHAQVAQSAGAPLVANGLVYVVEGAQNGANTALFALDAGTGTTRWRFASASPRLLEGAANGLVYIWGPDPTDATPGLFALDGVSGAIRWVQHTDNSLLGPVDGLIYVDSSTSLAKEALDAATGNVVWRRPGKLSGPPSIAGSGGVYFGSGGYSVDPCGPQYKTGYLYALDARTGAVRWRYQTDERPV